MDEAFTVVSIPDDTLLAHIAKPPQALYVQGNVAALWSVPMVAIVGTRNASPEGRAAAYRFARFLVQQGFCIVSGLARGIDSAAHHGALRGHLEKPALLPTVAVLGHGLDRIYPAQNRFLAAEILQAGGCLLSEYPPSIPPFKSHFPERNRIVAGLSRGTIIVEAREKSGSLITAGFAVNEGRDVFVLPGRSADPNYAGSHSLIRTGAILVSEPGQILEEWDLAPAGSFPTGNELRKYFGSAREKTLSQLLDASGLSTSELQNLLEEAVAAGALASLGSQIYLMIE